MQLLCIGSCNMSITSPFIRFLFFCGIICEDNFKRLNFCKNRALKKAIFRQIYVHKPAICTRCCECYQNILPAISSKMKISVFKYANMFKWSIFVKTRKRIFLKITVVGVVLFSIAVMLLANLMLVERYQTVSWKISEVSIKIFFLL